VSSGNPAFSSEMFAGYDQVYGAPRTRSTTTTVQGTMGKTAILLAILSFTALWSWRGIGNGDFPMAMIGISAIGGFITAMITIFKPSFAPITAPIYAALEGVFLGAISQIIEMRFGVKYPGIALQAVGLTAGVTFTMLFIYATGLVRVTDKLRAGIMMATGALALFYMVTILLSFFHVAMPLVFSSSPMGIGFSVLVVGLAAFNLLLDFDFIEQAAQHQAPKYMEWYGAFGLMVTLIWLYLEILRLLMKLSDRR
jgi:uncharacterized YccA/Bax inhibitor family protein